MGRLFLFFSGLVAFSATAKPLQTFYVSPDHFEIETVNSVTSLQVANDRFGTTASVTFVPAYDSALHALGFAFRKSTDELQIRTLPIEITDFTFGNSPFLKSMAVDGIEKKILGERVVVSIRFSNDITPAQARSFISLSTVLGTIEAKVVSTDGVPESLKGMRLKEVAALNQFHNKDRGTGSGSTAAKYRMLNHYKSEVTLTQVELISNPWGLDEWVKEKLMQTSHGRRECRRNLDTDHEWVCRIILEQSLDGCLSEALFKIASQLFPTRLIGAGYDRFVFDMAGKPVKWLEQGVPAPDFEQGPSQFERILASRSHPSMTEQEYAVRVDQYVSTLYPALTPELRASAVKTLVGIKSLEEDSATIRALMSVIMHSAELSQSVGERADALGRALVAGEGPGSQIETLFAARTRGTITEDGFETWVRIWLRKVFPETTEKELEVHVNSYKGYSSPTSNGPYNRVCVARLFHDIEENVGVVTKGGDASEWAEMRVRLRSYLEKNMTELSESERERMVLLLFTSEESPVERALWVELLNALESGLEESIRP